MLEYFIAFAEDLDNGNTEDGFWILPPKEPKILILNPIKKT